MKRIISALALVTLSVVGCGDDDDSGGDNTAGTAGTSSNAGTSSSSGGEPAIGAGGGPAAGGGGNMPPGNVACDPDVDGVCQNPTDCPFVESGEARLTAGMCGQTCFLGGNDDPACPVDCMLESVDMTADCADCYAAAAICGIENCAADCIDDPEAEVCVTCLEEAGCREGFNTCSGLEQ